MPNALKYIVDNSGHKTTVLVPIKVWQELNDNYEKLQNKLGIFTNIQLGLKEIKKTKATGKKLQTLNDFLK